MSGEVCWGVGGHQGSCGKRCGGGVGKCLGVWGEIRKDVEKSGRVYGVSGEGGKKVYGEKKCVGVWGKDVGRCRKMCQGVEPQHTSPHLLPHLSLHLPLPSPHPNTLSYTSLLYLFPHLAPHPNTFSYYPHISPHLLKVWRSYHVTKFLWRSYCGEVTMWRSYWQPPHLPSPSQSVAKLPCDEVCVAKLLWRSYHVAKLLATLPSAE